MDILELYKDLTTVWLFLFVAFGLWTAIQTGMVDSVIKFIAKLMGVKL